MEHEHHFMNYDYAPNEEFIMAGMGSTPAAYFFVEANSYFAHPNMDHHYDNQVGAMQINKKILQRLRVEEIIENIVLPTIKFNNSVDISTIRNSHRLIIKKDFYEEQSDFFNSHIKKPYILNPAYSKYVRNYQDNGVSKSGVYHITVGGVASSIVVPIKEEVKNIIIHKRTSHHEYNHYKEAYDNIRTIVKESGNGELKRNKIRCHEYMLFDMLRLGYSDILNTNLMSLQFSINGSNEFARQVIEDGALDITPLLSYQEFKTPQ